MHEQTEFSSFAFHFLAFPDSSRGWRQKTDSRSATHSNDWYFIDCFPHVHHESLPSCLNGQLFYQKGNWQQWELKSGQLAGTAPSDAVQWCCNCSFTSQTAPRASHYTSARSVSQTPHQMKRKTTWPICPLFVEFRLLNLENVASKTKWKQWHGVFCHLNGKRGHKVNVEKAVLLFLCFVSFLPQLIISDLSI